MATSRQFADTTYWSMLGCPNLLMPVDQAHAHPHNPQTPHQFFDGSFRRTISGLDIPTCGFELTLQPLDAPCRPFPSGPLHWALLKSLS